MRTNFTWIKPGQTFHETKHTREDIKVFQLKIVEKEGLYARAYVVVSRTALPVPPGKEILISQGPILLFRGQPAGSPAKISDEQVEIELLAKPAQANQHLRALCLGLKSRGPWDPLFANAANRAFPGEVLESRASLFYWPRTGGPVKISSIFKGGQKAKLGAYLLQGGVKYRLIRAPLTSIQIELCAEWVQECQGEVDLAPYFKFQFPEGIVNSLTGDLLQKNWWPANTPLGQSGYRLKSSQIQEIFPPQTGTTNLYPRTSIQLWNNDKSYRFKRQWYRVKAFDLQWCYRQKRKEIAHIQIDQEIQDLRLPPRKKNIKICLGNVGDPQLLSPWRPNHIYPVGFQITYGRKIYRCVSRHKSGSTFQATQWKKMSPATGYSLDTASFFNTQRGRDAVAYAIDIAKSHLAYGARVMEVTVRAPFEKIQSLTCDHTLTVVHPSLPGGRAEGKVVAVELVKDGASGTAYGEATLGCAIGTGEPPLINPPPDQRYVKMQYVEDTYFFNPPALWCTPGKITYGSWDNQYPKAGLLHPQSLRAEDFLTQIKVINPARDQNRALGKVRFEQHSKVLDVLKEKQTRISLRLKDIRSKGVLTHHIRIPIGQPYTPPKQIDLKG